MRILFLLLPVHSAIPERRGRASEEYMMRVSCILEQVGMERFAPHISNSLPKIGFLHLQSELHSWDPVLASPSGTAPSSRFPPLRSCPPLPAHQTSPLLCLSSIRPLQLCPSPINRTCCAHIDGETCERWFPSEKRKSLNIFLSRRTTVTVVAFCMPVL